MDDDGVPLEDMEAAEGKDDAELWFLPGPMEDEPDYLPPGPTSEAKESEIVDAWRAAEAGQAAQLARVAARLGVLDERLRRGPTGWRQRLALIEAADLSWLTQDRIGLDRLSLYMALRVSTVTDDAQALYRIGWTVRRLTGGPAPLARRSGVGDLETFLDRRDRPGQGERLEEAKAPSRVVEMAEREAFEDRAAGWLAMMDQAEDLSASAWEDAQQFMGPEQASIVIVAMLERFADIRSPGGYLRALTSKAASGQFSCGPMVMALMSRRTAA